MSPEYSLANGIWVADVHRYWFEELAPRQWFAADADIDEAIRNRFGELHRTLLAQDMRAAADPQSAVASVIVLDQFSRNLHRGTPDAYAADPVALAIAEAALTEGFDEEISVAERLFLYLPFEHSEDRARQQRSVELIATLGDAELLRYATEHKDVIDRFGRFPHRNAVLGRESTREEAAFLKSAQTPVWMKL